MTLLQIRTTPLGQGLSSPAILLFYHPVYSIMPVIDRKPFSIDNDDEHHKIKHTSRAKMTQTLILHKYLCLFP